MAVLKCKMCGGDLEIVPESTVCECEYCGTKQTVPTVDNEKKLNLFNRANRLRMASEFDKAASIYENIIAEFPEEAEAYWCLCLCNYGIEYVDDPATAKKIPTCHRASFESLQKDENFALALEYADVIAQKVYRDEAREIDRIMQEILAVSKNEKPYDVFICYKETDENGERTVDSVLAHDIYDALTAKGLHVFFARITLEDKLGRQYEPYIFAALNSAKVMLSVGTKYEYFHAVWVKNEWSRFLKIAAKDKTKVLIPCFKDIDAYDMPDEFKGLQAQDLGKLGATQDLLRGIEKILGSKTEVAPAAQVVVSQSGGPNTDALLKRGFMALEDREWKDAKDYFNQVLNMNAECAEAYLGTALADETVSTSRDYVFKNNLDNKNYKRAKQFASAVLLAELTALENEAEADRQEKRRQEEEAKRLAEEERAKKLAADKIRLTPIRNKLAHFSALIAAGYHHTVGLKSDGTVVAAGKNDYGQCKVTSWAEIVAVSVGYSHTVGLKSDGTVVAAGNNVKGQCAVTGWTDLVAVSAGCFHTVGLKSDGTTIAIGDNYYGQCDVTGWAEIVAVSAGVDHTVGLKSDGTAVAIGNNDWGQCDVTGWTDLVAVSARGYHTVGLKSDGTVVATGKNSFGQCDVADWTDIVAVSAMGNHTVGLKSDGTAVATGYDEYKQCEVTGWTDVVAVSAGNEHTVGLKSDGTVVATGKNDDDQCRVAGWKFFNSFENFAEERKRNRLAEEELARKQKEDKIRLALIRNKLAPFSALTSAGCNHTITLKSDGTAVATGKNNSGQCKVTGWTDLIAVCAGVAYTVGLKSDGTAVATGNNDYGQCDVTGWTDVVAVSAGDSHTVGLKSDGTAVATGNNDYGQCDVTGWTDVVAVSAGEYHTVGLKSDGTVVATKYIGQLRYYCGQCDVTDWTDLVAVSAGAEHTVGLKSDGTVVAAGNNDKGQCAVTGWTDIVAVSAGYFHTVGLKSDGTVFTAGNNVGGQCNVTSWTDIVAVCAGSVHTVGLKSDGTAVATGSNCSGECDVTGWKLFDSFENFEEEQKQKMAEKRVAIEKQKAAAYRSKGLCQHCGGSFKGLFTKKCTNCGKEKDY